MNQAINLLEQALSNAQSTLAANETAKVELFKTLNIDQVDTMGNDFADKYAAILKANIALRGQIADLEQAIFYAKCAKL